jgi:hypothetical protein
MSGGRLVILTRVVTEPDMYLFSYVIYVCSGGEDGVTTMPTLHDPAYVPLGIYLSCKVRTDRRKYPKGNDVGAGVRHPKNCGPVATGRTIWGWWVFLLQRALCQRP